MESNNKENASLLPVSQEEINGPSISNIIETQEMSLPRISRDDKKHYLSTNSLHFGDYGIVVDIKTNRIYAKNFDLEHQDHRSIKKGYKHEWFAFERNTAIVSYSEEEVD